MKVLIDTNVILDVLCNRKMFVEDSLKIFKLSETKQIDGYISALSIANIIYIMRKELSHINVKKILDMLSHIFNIIELNEQDLMEACNLQFNDYEDGIHCNQAFRIKADYIITRNINDYKNSVIKPISPNELTRQFLN